MHWRSQFLIGLSLLGTRIDKKPDAILAVTNPGFEKFHGSEAQRKQGKICWYNFILDPGAII